MECCLDLLASPIHARPGPLYGNVPSIEDAGIGHNVEILPQRSESPPMLPDLSASRNPPPPINVLVGGASRARQCAEQQRWDAIIRNGIQGFGQASCAAQVVLDRQAYHLAVWRCQVPYKRIAAAAELDNSSLECRLLCSMDHGGTTDVVINRMGDGTWVSRICDDTWIRGAITIKFAKRFRV